MLNIFILKNPYSTFLKGTNGGNGECYNGGYGTGEDVTAYVFKNFYLSPGAGSKPFEDRQFNGIVEVVAEGF